MANGDESPEAMARATSMYALMERILVRTSTRGGGFSILTKTAILSRNSGTKRPGFGIFVSKGGTHMSTCGFVGIGTADQWEGRYNHSDSYPTGLGVDVWATAQRFLQADRHLRGFAARLLGFTNWAQMETWGICAYCGQKTGHPHSIDGRIYVEGHQTAIYPDP